MTRREFADDDVELVVDRSRGTLTVTVRCSEEFLSRVVATAEARGELNELVCRADLARTIVDAVLLEHEAQLPLACVQRALIECCDAIDWFDECRALEDFSFDDDPDWNTGIAHALALAKARNYAEAREVVARLAEERGFDREPSFDDLRKARDAVGVGSKTELEAKAEEIRKNESRPSASVRIARINEWARRFT